MRIFNYHNSCKTTSYLSAALLVWGTSLSLNSARATLVAEDGFATPGDYTSGVTIDTVDGGTGYNAWSVDSSANANNVLRYQGSTTSLGYTDGTNTLSTTAGSMEGFAAGSGTGDASRSLDSALSGEVWFSVLTVLTTNSSFNWQLSFRDSSSAEQFTVFNGSTDNRFRVRDTVGTNTQTFLTGVDPFDDPSDGFAGRLIVGKVTDAGGSAGNQTLDVWVNPTDLTDVESGGAGASVSYANTTIGSLSEFSFIKGSSPTGYFDELRFGTTAADVLPLVAIPEASQVLLFSVLAVGCIIYRKKAEVGKLIGEHTAAALGR